MRRLLEPLLERLRSDNHRKVVWVIGALLLTLWCVVFAWSIMERRSLLAANSVILEGLRAAVQTQTRSLFKQAESSLTVVNHWMAAHPEQDPTQAPDFIALVDKLRRASDVRGVIGLALAFQRAVIADGVESVDHGTQLIAQGYAIARPMPAVTVPAWCATWQSARLEHIGQQTCKPRFNTRTNRMSRVAWRCCASALIDAVGLGLPFQLALLEHPVHGPVDVS